ncbi:alpha/beta fold hydrolase [Nonomuraea diastatica]|uniref:Alpha/beta fold hydrolase n=1 Tax=Nonomuraea diastatica TaxID=1848329 RepID=A0A4R4W2V1_9ACTN|nr:alpha/beta fold hydrolase [Nonomuraea diastatica]TDD11117.1 alpha/beta fold hydrolase [Nonomuraea diastatica]
MSARCPRNPAPCHSATPSPAPAIVWGGSLGAFIVLDLLSRHPALVRAALVHEPPLFTVLPDTPLPPLPHDVTDPRTAMAAHARRTLGGDCDRLDAHQRERLLANGEAFFGADAPGAAASLPSPGVLASELAGSSVPLYVLAAPGEPEPALRRASRWVADQAGTTVIDLPGGHMPYAVEPEATARLLTDILHHPPAREIPT